VTFERNSFKNLRLWQDAQALADEICELADQLPRTRSEDVIARQVIRSATSIAANVAERHGRFSLAAYRHHLLIARGSATETRGWIDLLLRRRHISADRAGDLDNKCGGLTAILTLRIRDLEARQSPQIRDEQAAYDPTSPDVRMFGSSDVRGDEDPEGDVRL
jgi:four helix bundle protein